MSLVKKLGIAFLALFSNEKIEKTSDNLLINQKNFLTDVNLDYYASLYKLTQKIGSTDVFNTSFIVDAYDNDNDKHLVTLGLEQHMETTTPRNLECPDLNLFTVDDVAKLYIEYPSNPECIQDLKDKLSTFSDIKNTEWYDFIATGPFSVFLSSEFVQALHEKLFTLADVISSSKIAEDNFYSSNQILTDEASHFSLDSYAVSRSYTEADVIHNLREKKFTVADMKQYPIAFTESDIVKGLRDELFHIEDIKILSSYMNAVYHIPYLRDNIFTINDLKTTCGRQLLLYGIADAVRENAFTVNDVETNAKSFKESKAVSFIRSIGHGVTLMSECETDVEPKEASLLVKNSFWNIRAERGNQLSDGIQANLGF